jgi:N-acetylglucosaminyldiphosphoundecaprenol N-acetyl-beta-D-mannosaminyltransferase
MISSTMAKGRLRIGGATRIYLFGVPIDRLSLAEALERIEHWLERGSTHLVFTPDTPALMRARWDESLRYAYLNADLVTADGMGLVWASRLLSEGLPGGRVAGIDLVEALCAQAVRRGYKLFLLGAEPGVAEEAACSLRARYPSLAIVGVHHGYFDFDSPQEEALIKDIRRAAPDLLLVGMGVPRQERWMVHNRARLDVPVMMGVGGSFDVLAGRVRRAPQAWQQLGLEWLWRLLHEPRRLKRARLIPLFMIRVLLYRLSSDLGLQHIYQLQLDLGAPAPVVSAQLEDEIHQAGSVDLNEVLPKIEADGIELVSACSEPQLEMLAARPHSSGLIYLGTLQEESGLPVAHPEGP